MHRVNLAFLTMLGLATLSMGLLWRQVRSLIAAPITYVNVTLSTFYTLILVSALLGLARILCRLALIPPDRAPTSSGR